MKRLMLAALVGAALAGSIPAANAQGIGYYQRPSVGPGYRPAVSPYLNLLRGNPGASYYSLVRPQQDTFRSIDALQYGLQGVQQGMYDPNAAVGVPPSQGVTGHSTRFFNLSHYYTFPFPRSGPGSSGGNMTPTQRTPQGGGFGTAGPRPGPGIGIVIGGGTTGDNR